MSKPVGNLEEEAMKRKERLKNMKRKFEEVSIESDDKKENKIEIPKPMFRNYRKEDDENANITESITEISEIREQLDAMKTPLEITDIEVGNLAPRKIDFDLKRAIAKKLQKLEKRTQLAISELIRMRLKSQEDEEDFVRNINVGAKQAAMEGEKEDSE